MWRVFEPFSPHPEKRRPSNTHTHTGSTCFRDVHLADSLTLQTRKKVLHTQKKKNFIRKKRGRENGFPDQTHAAAFLYYSTFKLFFSL
jgi:hypothetical protein